MGYRICRDMIMDIWYKVNSFKPDSKTKRETAHTHTHTTWEKEREKDNWKTDWGWVFFKKKAGLAEKQIQKRGVREK